MVVISENCQNKAYIRAQALPRLCDKGQFDYFLIIRFLGFSFLQSIGLLRFAPNGERQTEVYPPSVTILLGRSRYVRQ